MPPLPEDETPGRPRPVEPPTVPGDDAPTAGMAAAPPSALPPAFSAGDLAAGRFRIVRFIAQGGMGEVYAAEDLELREHVALKTVRPAFGHDEYAVERFRREVLLARRVTHPNVCRIFDVFRHRGADNPVTGEPGTELVFLTMELLSGRTLAEHLRRHGPLPLDEALELAEQMAEGLQAAHRAGVTHRDFKSNNVVLEPQREGPPRVVVTDFGLAGAHGESEQPQDEAGLTMGTPAYMAPEQVEGREVGPAADVYALGVVLYEMVTGRLPFVALTAHATATLRLREKPASPRDHRPDLDARWESVILRCLERDPARRFPSAAEALEALRPPSWKRRALLGLAALAVLAILGSGLLAWRERHRLRFGPLKSVQVTTSTGLDLFPALSPDGQRVAFSSDRSGAFELYVRELKAGSRDVQVTRDGGQNVQPSWSPDGQTLAFHSKGRGGLWLVPAAGGEARQLTPFGSRPSWSPKGGWIAFQEGGLVDLAANAVAAMPPSTLWRVHPEGGEPERLTAAGNPPGGHGEPEWSADERLLVFSSSDRRSSAIWVLDVARREVQRLSPEGLHQYDPVFAPDGRRVYYAGVTASNSYGLWAQLLDAEGRPDGAAVQLAELGLGISRQLSLARDGRTLAFSALRINSNVWSLPLRAGQRAGDPVALTTEIGRHSRPAFSADGMRVAFEKWQPGTNPDIWVMSADGSSLQQATTDPAVDTIPSWYPDGKLLLFRSDRGQRPAMWELRLEGRVERRLAEMGPDMDWARLSPDGQSLVYQLRSQGGSINLWRSELPNGRPRQLTFEPEFAGFASWSPDGRWLAVQVKRGEGFQVAIMPSEGGPLDVLTTAEGQSWPYSWSRDGRQVAFAGFRDGLWNVYSVSRDDRRETRLTDYRRLNAYVRYPAWSPRDDQIVFEYAETTGNVWLLEGLR